ncbi:hypothetical protein B0H17DRAFT_1125002 [Mycena rosella]|uniref:Uncharacterized protein n=1 Tax=Mycena rosella TaxID=1033263 RepID=A0AAD7MAL9_MYCRO|nr:hypothetical protein B0H17DRAFT_1125002 [Mycena rosella]
MLGSAENCSDPPDVIVPLPKTAAICLELLASENYRNLAEKISIPDAEYDDSACGRATANLHVSHSATKVTFSYAPSRATSRGNFRSARFRYTNVYFMPLIPISPSKFFCGRHRMLLSFLVSNHHRYANTVFAVPVAKKYKTARRVQAPLAGGTGDGP